MKTVAAIFIIAILTYLSQDFGPWWICVVIAFVVSAALGLRSGAGFVSGLAGVALAWGFSTLMVNSANDGVMAGRIGEMFGGMPAMAVVLVSALLGGLVSGLAGMSGALLRNQFAKKIAAGAAT